MWNLFRFSRKKVNEDQLIVSSNDYDFVSDFMCAKIKTNTIVNGPYIYYISRDEREAE